MEKVSKHCSDTLQQLYSKDFIKEEASECNLNNPTENDTGIDILVDFYKRFLYRMEHMMKIGKEKGYNLISFMGP